MAIQSLAPVLVPLVLAMGPALGCGADPAPSEAFAGRSSSQTTTSKQDKNMPAKATQEASMEFAALEVKTHPRTTPQSVEEAAALLKKMRNLFDSGNVPQALSNPVTRDSARAFAQSMLFLDRQRSVDLEFLEGFEPEKVKGVDRISVQQLENSRTNLVGRLQKYFPGEYKHRLDASRMQVGSMVEGKMGMVRMAAEADMSDAGRVRNLFANDMLNASREEAILVATANADIMVMLDELMGIPSEWKQKRSEVHASIRAYRKNMEMAVDVFQPPADIKDEELAKIAKDVLGREAYGLPEYERLIVNAPKRRESSEEYFLDWDAETITKTRREWDEFQVATIEKHGDGYQIWFNSILFYHSGPSTVLKGKWVLGPRHLSSPIAKKNIGN